MRAAALAGHNPDCLACARRQAGSAPSHPPPATPAHPPTHPSAHPPHPHNPPSTHPQYNTLIMITDKGEINHVYRCGGGAHGMVGGWGGVTRACVCLVGVLLTPSPLLHRKIFPWVPKEPWTAGHETSVAVGPKGLIVGERAGLHTRRARAPPPPHPQTSCAHPPTRLPRRDDLLRLQHA